MDNSKLQLILENLESWLKIVISSLPHENGPKPHQNEVKKFYKNISFFIHYVWTTDELKYIYLNLLKYSNENSSALNKKFDADIRYELKKIANLFINQTSYASSAKLIDSKFKELLNPFPSDNPTLTTEEWINQLNNIPDELIWTSEIIGTIIRITQGDVNGNGLLQNWQGLNQADQSQIIESLKKLGQICFQFEYCERYEYEFSCADAAKQLSNIHIAFNPQLNPIYWELDSNNRLYVSKYREGSILPQPESPKDLICYCHKLHHKLKIELANGQCKNAVLEKFRAYCELYKLAEYQNLKGKRLERAFQKEFESFLFQNGIYPVSEAQLGNGRLDTLGISLESAILYEFKQIGFGESNSQKNKPSKNQLKSIFRGLLQANIYHNRLAGLKGISREVYIVIFSKYPLIIEPKQLSFDHIEYNFFVINLSKVNPCKQAPIMVDLKDFVT